MNLTILGCYAATPRTLTNPTSQVLEIMNRMFLIDCGEGTQVQLRKHKIRFSRINHVFLSHLHGDHFYGLIGLISTFSLLNRKQDLHIYGPKGVKEVTLLQLKISASWTSYNLYFHELEGVEPQIVFEDEKVMVTTIPLKHRIYTNGYLFEEKPGDRKLNIEAVERNKIDTCYYNKIKGGGDITLDDGRIIPNSELTFDPAPPKKYAFCSDTIYDEGIVPLINGIDVLYHESTFLESEAHLCERTMHSTAKQAANIALKAGVKKLILGHFSTRYNDINVFREEAGSIFPDVELADDGRYFEF